MKTLRIRSRRRKKTKREKNENRNCYCFFSFASFIKLTWKKRRGCVLANCNRVLLRIAGFEMVLPNFIEILSFQFVFLHSFHVLMFVFQAGSRCTVENWKTRQHVPVKSDK